MDFTSKAATWLFGSQCPMMVLQHFFNRDIFLKLTAIYSMWGWRTELFLGVIWVLWHVFTWINWWLRFLKDSGECTLPNYTMQAIVQSVILYTHQQISIPNVVLFSIKDCTDVLFSSPSSRGCKNVPSLKLSQTQTMKTFWDISPWVDLYKLIHFNKLKVYAKVIASSKQCVI